MDRDTLFGPERIKARAIDWDPIYADFHQGARPQSRNQDALGAAFGPIPFASLYTAATDQMPKPNNPLPRRSHPYMVRATIGDGSSCIAVDLAEYLDDKGMKHVRGAPLHSQTQGKIDRWRQTHKNRILLENYFFEGELEAAIYAFIDH